MNSSIRHVASSTEADGDEASDSPTHRLLQAAKSITDFESDRKSGPALAVRKSSLNEIRQTKEMFAPSAGVLRFRPSTREGEAGASVFPLKPPSEPGRGRKKG